MRRRARVDRLIEQMQLKKLEGKNRHGLRWGYGFSYVYTPLLAARCPYEPVNCSEDYGLVLDAAAKGLRCLAFGTAADDAIALHVTHGRGNSSAVPFGVRMPIVLPELPTEETSWAQQLDALFAEPCHVLVRALMREAAEKEAARMATRARPAAKLEQRCDGTTTSSEDRANNPFLRAALGLESSVASVLLRSHVRLPMPPSDVLAEGRGPGRGQAAYKLQGF